MPASKTWRTLTPEERRAITERRPLTLAPNALHQEDVAAWLKAKREAVENWIATHTPDMSPTDLAMATRRGGRYPGEVPMTPVRGTATAAVETAAPRTMADLMMYAAGPLRRAIPESRFTRVPERYKADVYKRAASLDPESPLWSDPVPPKMKIYQDKTGEDVYYGLAPSVVSPEMQEVEMVSSKMMPRAMPDAVQRGGETSLLFGVPNKQFPAGELPQRTDAYGFEPVRTEGFSTTFDPPSSAVKEAWATQGWQPGDPLPPVQFMMRPTTRGYPRTIPHYDPDLDITLPTAVRQARGRLPEESVHGVPVQTDRSPSPLVPFGARRPGETLEHRSSVPGLTRLDPQKVGTGSLGQDRARQRDYPESFVPRSYTTREGGTIEDRFRGLPTHEGLAITDRLYDLSADPWQFAAQARVAAQGDQTLATNLAERAVRDAGFAGVYYSQNPNPASRDTVALFEPLPVRPRVAATPAWKKKKP